MDAVAVMSCWAVFLDRDGTLNEEVGRISRPEQLRLIPGAGRALRALREAGALLILVTNQAIVARGVIDEEELARIHRRLTDLLAREGAVLDAIYYCPHHPDNDLRGTADARYRRDCACRKPKPGLILNAAERFAIDLNRSFVVGDSTKDVTTARAAGCRPVLVRTGHAGKDGTCPDARPEKVAEDLAQAADWILAQVREIKP